MTLTSKAPKWISDLASKTLKDRDLVEPLDPLLLVNIAISLVPMLGDPPKSVAMCLFFCGHAGPAMFWPQISPHFDVPGLSWRALDYIAGPEHDMTTLCGVLFGMYCIMECVPGALCWFSPECNMRLQFMSKGTRKRSTEDPFGDLMYTSGSNSCAIVLRAP
ncbi:unnamed protein product [Prorocentrum cordatum]|uniref:Derlin n=1 Tax=Prorocentrum cordatum TaxID=2364126 RepID=A0ABN9YI61_9DINO|nr:unnamed protein product [Polarella glacialis]CAK0911344.1 unnamed protein product [Polarella glacialis]